MGFFNGLGLTSAGEKSAMAMGGERMAQLRLDLQKFVDPENWIRGLVTPVKVETGYAWTTVALNYHAGPTGFSGRVMFPVRRCIKLMPQKWAEAPKQTQII